MIWDFFWIANLVVDRDFFSLVFAGYVFSLFVFFLGYWFINIFVFLPSEYIFIFAILIIFFFFFCPLNIFYVY